MIAALKSEFRNPRWSVGLGIVGLVILFFALRWNNYNAPLSRDEGEYSYGAQLLIRGIAPYEHAFIQKPPMVIYSYALAKLLLPDCFWAPRLLAAVFVALAAVLLGCIAALEFGKSLALTAMWLMTPIILLPELDEFNADTEVFMLLPLMAAVAVYCFSRQNGHQRAHWFLAGFFAATALLYKYTCLPVLAFLFVVWMIETWRFADSLGLVFRRLAFAVAGGVVASALELGYFLIHDGGAGLGECTVVFNRYYAESSIFKVSYFFSKLEVFFVNWWILFLIPWAILLQPQPRIWFWLGIFACALVSTGASGYGHYYVIIMPFLALLNVAGIQTLASRLSQRPETVRRIKILIVSAVMLLVLRPLTPWLFCSPERFAEGNAAGQPFVEAQLVADKVSQMSSPDDFVFVAGSEPEILCYANRFSPTRFIHSCALMIPTPMVHDYQHETIQALQKRQPKLIVYAQTPTSWLRQPVTPSEYFDFLNDFLKNYDLVGGYVKLEGQKGRWSEQLNIKEFEASSLLLYKLKEQQPLNSSATPR